MQSKSTAFLSLLLFTPLLSAEPVVLGREANTVSTEPYRSYFKTKLAVEKQSPDTIKKQTKPDPAEYLSQRRFLPVHSPSLTPGTVPAVKGIAHAGNHPLCIVGADPQSLEWIARVKPRLLEVGARCQIVEADTEQSLATLVQALAPLPWFVASGEFLAEQHDIRHYPVLISKRGIEQ